MNIVRIIILIGSVLLSHSCSETKSEVTTIKIPDMLCKMCKEDITTVLQEFGAVKNIDFDFGNKTITVEYDANEVSVRDFEQAIASVGYDANNTQALATANKRCTCRAKDMMTSPDVQSKSEQQSQAECKNGNKI